jgi:ornithine decarboxylase
MIPGDVRAPTIPIPFHKLLKVVAIVDERNAQTKELLDEIAAVERDVSEDAGVGAYIALVDGERLEHARQLARSVREIGFRIPLRGLAVEKEDHEIAGPAVSIFGIDWGNFTTFSILPAI